MTKSGPLLRSVLILAGLAAFAVLAPAQSRPPQDCGDQEHPTGCQFPALECELGPITDPVSTCQDAANVHRCDNFTWEKCCAATCLQLTGLRVTQLREQPSDVRERYTRMEQCMGACVIAPEALVYTAREPRRQ